MVFDSRCMIMDEREEREMQNRRNKKSFIGLR